MARDDRHMIQLRAWTLPLIVAGIAVPIVAGFWVGGPPLGMAAGFVAAASLVVLAARARPMEAIETARATDGLEHILVVLSRELDDPMAVEYVAGQLDEDVDSEVRLLAPAKSGLLDRWASDLGEAWSEAQRKLVLSSASLGAARVPSRGSIGDEDIVRAVEDELRTFPASQVILVTGGDEEDKEGARAAEELAARLPQPLSRVVVASAARSHPGTGENRPSGPFAHHPKGQSKGDARLSSDPATRGALRGGGGGKWRR